MVLDRYSISVSTHSLHCSIGEYDISVCMSPPMPIRPLWYRSTVIGLGNWNTWPALTEFDYKWGQHFYSRSALQTAGVTRVTAARRSRHQRHPAAQHAAWCFNYRQAGQTHASVSKGQTGSWNLTRRFTTLACNGAIASKLRLHKSFIN